MCRKLTLKHTVCKYFTGIKDARYGDVQSAAPCYASGDTVDFSTDEYSVSYVNGFANVTFYDNFLVKYISGAARGVLVLWDDQRVPEPDKIGADYRRYVFSNYVFDLWGRDKLKEACDACEACCACNVSDKQADAADNGKHLSAELRRLFVMALFLIKFSKNFSQNKNDPRESGSFMKLYDIFTKDLYDYLSSKTIADAAWHDMLITAAAINIPVCREA